MRIAHVSCIAPPDTGGIGMAAAREVASLQERGHDAYQISLTTHAGLRIGNAGCVYALSRLVAGADIVHLHYPFYGTTAQLVSLKRRGRIRRLVATLHMDAQAGGVRGFLFDLHRRLFQSRALAAMDKLVVSSRDYAEHGSYRSVLDRAVEIPFGIDERLFSPGPSRRAGMSLSERQAVFAFVGAMDTAHAFKGVPIALRALSHVPEAHLLLIGDGDQRSGYEALAREVGVADRCHFMGRVPPDRLIDAYRSADALVLPSTSGAEAFGLVALEAQACGIPVIASDLPGVRTVVLQGQTGLLVPPKNVDALAEAMRRLSLDDGLRTRFGRTARERVMREYTWERHMDKLEAVYASCRPRE